MRKIIVFTLLIALISCSKNQVINGKVVVIPEPSEQVLGKGHFELSENTRISVENESQKKTADQFFKLFETTSGWNLQATVGTEGDIQFLSDGSIKNEGYQLDVDSKGIIIKAGSASGFYYALQTFKQLLPSTVYSGDIYENVNWGIPAVTIKDEPAFGWRGYMLDVSRHFFGVEKVKEVLDFMAESKLNRFHWHLADDNGWRVEIKSYPKLTEVGAWRVNYSVSDENVSNWWGRPAQKPGEKATYGGFYTQEEIKELVAYAKERHIEIIPEIDMPGHAQATIAAYPEIGCIGAAPYVATGGARNYNTYNPGKEETFEFAEKMLNEIMDLFPYKYVHIGGDECNKSQWKIDPFAQRRLKEEGLNNVEELQSYFIKRIEKIINKRNRALIGWDEILEGGLAPNATVMSWRGEKGGIASAKAGHEVIMTPSQYCYIDLKQGHSDMEPNLGYSSLLLSKSYSYQVIPDDLSEAEGKLIKGIQANMWTESISDWGKLTYMTFPRLYAVAETGWTSQSKKNWDHFSEKLETQFERLDAQGVRYAVSAFSPWISHKGDGKEIEISLKTEVNNLDVFYTLDGTEPDTSSSKYNGAFKIDKSADFRARSYKGVKPVGYTSRFKFPIHKAAGISKGSADISSLTDLNYAQQENNDKNWVRFNNGVEVKLEFDEPTMVKELSINNLRFTIAGVYLPESFTVYGSIDGNSYSEIGSIDQKVISHIQGRNKVETIVPLTPTKVKSLKVVAKEVNPIPKGHHAEGQTASIKIDEIVVN